MRGKLTQIIEAADTTGGVEMARAELAEGVTPLDLFRSVIEPVLKDVGDRFSRLEIFLPELMKAGAVVKAIQQQALEPAIRQAGTQTTAVGKVVIGTCQGDIHDIGKNMVALMLQVNGFNVVDLGTNVEPKEFIAAAKREEADIIAMSSLLTPSLPYIKDLVDRLNAFGLRGRFLVVAGGAPVTRAWANTAGVDGFAEDAIQAVEVCRQLLAVRKGVVS